MADKGGGEDKDKKPAAKRLGGLGTGAAGRLGERPASTHGMSEACGSGVAPGPTSHDACWPFGAPAGSLRSGDGAGPSSAPAPSATAAGAAASNARKVRRCRRRRLLKALKWHVIISIRCCIR